MSARAPRRRSSESEDRDLPQPDPGGVGTREAIRAAQRIASQLHQLIAASLTVAGLRSERDIVESLAVSAQRVFDADVAVLSLESGPAAPLRGVAQRWKSDSSAESDDEPTLENLSVRSRTSPTWIERDWLVAAIAQGRNEASGILAVRRAAGEFQNEDREVLTLLAQMAATSLSSIELSREIASSETRLRTLVDTAPAGIVEVDLEGNVRWWNRAASQIFAWPAHDAELDSLPLFPTSTIEELRALWSQARGGEAPSNRELVDVEIRDRRRHLTVSAVLLPSDELPSILMLVEDVTDHRQLKAEVRHAQQMEIRGRVASSVAHDFNNLLTLISGYAEILTSELGSSHPSLAMVKDIQKTATRASTLTAQLQTIGRPPSLEPIVLDPVAMLENIANVIERIVGDSIATTWSLDPDAGSIQIDAGQFEQMMLNLAINARDAMPSGGELHIQVGLSDVGAERAMKRDILPGTYVTIHVADTGSGMDSETLAKCFDTFFTTKGPFKGTGMGLAAARRLVEDSNGAISVQSEVGAGTDFEILLPALALSELDSELEPELEAASMASDGRTATVLIAEDDGDLRRLMTKVLRRDGFKVVAVASGEAALDESRSFEGPIELLVSDVMMSEMTGPELASIMQGERQGLRVLLTSGTADPSVTSHLAAGTSAFLPKPFRPSEFIDLVQELLARAAH